MPWKRGSKPRSLPNNFTWKRFPHCWPFWGQSLTKFQQWGAFIFSLILAWTSCWTNSEVNDGLRRHNAHMTSLKRFTVSCRMLYPRLAARFSTLCYGEIREYDWTIAAHLWSPTVSGPVYILSLYLVQVTKVWLSCYLILLSVDSKTM